MCVLEYLAIGMAAAAEGTGRWYEVFGLAVAILVFSIYSLVFCLDLVVGFGFGLAGRHNRLLLIPPQHSIKTNFTRRSTSAVPAATALSSTFLFLLLFIFYI